MNQDLITGARFMGAIIFFLAAYLLVFMNRKGRHSKTYDHSRWMFVFSCILLGIQAALQFIYHFREQSPSLAWVINMVCYVIVVPLFNLAELNLLRVGKSIRRECITMCTFYLICTTLYITGYYTHTLVNDDEPYKTVTFGIAILLCAFIGLMTWQLTHEMNKDYQDLNEEDAYERELILHHTSVNMKALLCVSFIVPWVGISSSLILNSIARVIVYFLLVKFIHSFYLYSIEDVKQKAMVNGSDNNDAKNGATSTATPIETEEEKNERIKSIINAWVEKKAFVNPTISINEVLCDLYISNSALNDYIENTMGISGGFRKWIQWLRIEESKKLMLTERNLTLDSIAEMVGMSNGSALARAFKAQTGITPSAWITKNSKKNRKL